MSRLLVGLTLLTPLVGATTTAAPVPVHLMPKLYFPTRVGAKWVYQVRENEWTLSVTAVEQVDDGTLVSVTNHRPNGKSFLDEKMLVTRGGLTQVETSEGKLGSPWCRLKIPCIVGEKWESDCSNEFFVQKWECTTLGTEEVEVPAGKFTAVRVRSVLVSEAREVPSSLPGGINPHLMQLPRIHLPAPKLVAWYASGIGLIKSEQDSRCVWLLKSFRP
jgi:hypothetical protein